MGPASAGPILLGSDIAGGPCAARPPASRHRLPAAREHRVPPAMSRPQRTAPQLAEYTAAEWVSVLAQQSQRYRRSEVRCRATATAAMPPPPHRARPLALPRRLL